jgi:hypothetical protein
MKTVKVKPSRAIAEGVRRAGSAASAGGGAGARWNITGSEGCVSLEA